MPELCAKKHRNKFTDCQSQVVYEIPLSCGRKYIGQTGRSFNDRAREHRLNVQNKSGGHLADHCRRCGCAPDFQRSSFLKRASNKLEKEIMGAFLINKAGDQCVSDPSLFLSKDEMAFLEGHV